MGEAQGEPEPPTNISKAGPSPLTRPRLRTAASKSPGDFCCSDCMRIDRSPQEILTRGRRGYGSNFRRLKHMPAVVLGDVPRVSVVHGKAWACCVAKATSPPQSNLTVDTYLQNLI